MKNSSGILPAFLFLVVLSPSPYCAQAEQPAGTSCDISCPAGQKVVSFTDGDNVACVCAPETQMVPTEPDPAVASSRRYEDEGQKE